MLTIEELHMHYKNVKARIENAAKKPSQMKEVPPKLETEQEPEPKWKSVFDDAKKKYGVIQTPFMNIVREVCEAHDVKRDEIFKKNRSKKLVMARGVIYDRIRKELGWSYPKIGKLFGRDHTTILHGVRLAREYMSQNEGGKNEE
jgi:chromosomal replication initiator protein